MKQFLFIVFFQLCSTAVLLHAQNQAETTHSDCLTPATIIVPFDNVLNRFNEESIYYTPDDKYTYWYKIIAAQSDTLYYELQSINEEDEYNAILFKYEGNSFCNDVVYKNTNPVSNTNKNKLYLKAGDIYYLGVLHLNGKGCGHYLRLAFSGKIKEIKAIQNECIEDAIERYVYIPRKKLHEAIKLPELKLSPKPQNKKTNATVLSFKNTVTGKPIDVVFTITPLNQNKKTEHQTQYGFFTLKDTGIVLLSVDKLGYNPVEQTINLTYQNTDTVTINLTPIKQGEKLVMYSIYFYPNTYALKPESKPELKKLAAFMKENPSLKFEIQGHTNGNNRISKNKKYEHLGEEWNFSGSAKKLSKMRAETIKKFLVQQGINPESLITVGYGGDKMIIKNPRTMKEAMRNIRVEVHVVE